MTKITPVLLVRSLDVIRGGVTKASIKRANVLAKEYEKVIIVTIVFQQNHKQIIKELYDKKILSKNIQVVNFFEDIKPNKGKPKNSKTKYNYLVKERGFVEFPVENMKEEPSYRYYENGLYTKYKRFNQDGTLKFVDYMDADRYRLRREEFDERGILVRIRQMDKLTNKSRLDRYFDNKGFCFLSVHINSKTGKEGRAAIFKEEPIELESLYEYQERWLNSLLNGIAYPVVTCELRGLHKMLQEVKHDNIKKIEVIHTNHIKEPFDDVKNIKNSYRQLFENTKELDKVVFLTKEQKDDVESVYGKNDKFVVIPHASGVDERTSSKNKLNYNSKLAVTLARYHEDKRLDESIKAFKFVVEKVPEAKYYIYGYGNLKGDLKSLIKKLELENNVYLKKYTTEPKEAYRKATCSILTSRQEGFAMVITESMSVGTPVISYDTKYGPEDIIEDGVDGFIVPQGDTKKLAEKIIEVMKDRDLRDNLSENALHVNDTFSEVKYKERWLDVIKD
ncbi:poly(glycerol-phosphate) alpha-glucosyltransferase [Virgibacillus halotolerans]|uniref:glycosyltransferase n=1 Tax=Virgibacillus halotolerans TaxID=1071053 RepID=UPI00195F3FBD|nr:glycosyltransferase [Virgibacillus halotolerans]MBM7600165.1 poly(glycerol-phosphate) alpha-glucosyltransferase [Virgibacillus halotolerans]